MGSKNIVFVKLVSFTVAALVFASPLTTNAAPPADKADPSQDAVKAQNWLSPRAEVMYHILVAELAGKRGHFDAALKNYQLAVRNSKDPALTERAIGIALYVKDNAALLEMARRWYELTPRDRRSRQALTLALLRNGQLQQALPYLESIRAAIRNDGQDGFAAVSMLLEEVESEQITFQVMEKLRTLHPESRYALYHYAISAMEMEYYTKALEAVQTVLDQDVKWTPGYLLKAQVLAAQESMDKALDSLAQATKTLPFDQDLRKGYARLLVDAKRHDEAFRQFQVLHRQNPEDMETLFALGVLASELERFDEAETYLMQVLRDGAQDSVIYYELGKLEELRENYRKAKDWYARVSDDQRYLIAQVRMGAMWAKLDKYPSLTDHFLRLRQDNPEQVISLYISEAEILREEGRYKAAFDLLSRALAQHPDDEDLLYTRALAAEKLNRLDILERDLRRVIEANPKNGHALNALGYTLADRTDRYQEALDYLNQAIALLPEDAAVVDSMGWVLYRLGNHQKALEYLRRAYKLSDDDEIAAHLSQVLWAMGKHEEARKIWKKALEETPESEHLLKIRYQFAP